MKENDVVAQEVMSVLHLYCNASGQKINLEKSSIFFSKGCSNELRNEVKQGLNVQQEIMSEIYLGTPTNVGR